MKQFHTRMKKLEAQMDRLQRQEIGGVLFYDALTGEFHGAYSWKPGEPHTREIEVDANGIPCPVGFTGTMIIDDIMDD